jgi:hypothetical protein
MFGWSSCRGAKWCDSAEEAPAINSNCVKAKIRRKFMKQNAIRSKIKTALVIPALAIAILGQATLVKAIYYDPPTWQPMTMLNVSFDSSTKTLSVVDEATKLGVGVYPVLTAAPGTYDPVTKTYDLSVVSYDPAKPWSVLNGTAYSRRLGWNPGTGLDQIDDIYGAGADIWIECISRSSGLNSYLAVGRYGVNANNTTIIDPNIDAYSGIFGTDGSSTKWLWDGKMDHNTYAVDLSAITEPNQLFSATYKVYVGDGSGNEILNPDGSSASSIETWTWQGPSVIPTVPEAGTTGLLFLCSLTPLIVGSRRLGKTVAQ